MLIRALLLILLFTNSAFAAPPVITAPSAVTAASAVATSLKGISIAETGASPILNYTVTISDAAGLLSATGTGVTQSGTASLKIGPTSIANVTAALATLTFTGQADTITVAVEDANLQIAAPATIQVQTISGTHEYIVYATQAAALARSTQQCAVFGASKCDGVQTVYWWGVIGPLNAGTAGSVSVAANSYAVEIRPGDPYYGPTTSEYVAACAVGCGLTPTEQSNLVTAAQLAPLVAMAVAP
jgi:hypothetical protein